MEESQHSDDDVYNSNDLDTSQPQPQPVSFKKLDKHVISQFNAFLFIIVYFKV